MEIGTKQPVLEIASKIDVVRDFIDVRDAARAVISVVEKGKSGEVYNIATGRSLSTKSVLTELVQLTKSTTPIKAKLAAKPVSTGSSLRGSKSLSFNPADRCALADVTKLTTELGFSPKYSLKESLEDSLTYWRSEMKKQQQLQQSSN
jgi:GDP-4-dehydro-6-deoxy-D-mannose reductase